MPPKKVPTSTNAYAALDDIDLDSLIKKEDLDKIVLDHAADKEAMTANLKETRSGLDDLNQKFNNLVELQEGNSETLKGLSTAVTSLARLLEAKTGDTGDGWSQPTESPAGSVHSETASYRTAIPVPVRYSADAAQGKDDVPPDMHATAEANTKLSDRKKQRAPSHDDDLPGAVEELERKLLTLKDQASRAVNARQPAQLLQQAPPRLAAFLERVADPLTVYAHLNAVREYRNRHPHHNLEHALQNSISASVLLDHLRVGTGNMDSQASLECVTDAEILAAIHRELSWKIPNCTQFARIMQAFPFRPRREVSSDTVTGPEDIILVQAWLQSLLRLYTFMVSIVRAGKYPDAIPVESQYRTGLMTTVKAVVYEKLQRHFPWFGDMIWPRFRPDNNRAWTQAHATLDSLLEQAKITMQDSYSLNLACASARLQQEHYRGEKQRQEEVQREAERAKRIPLLQRPSPAPPKPHPFLEKDRLQGIAPQRMLIDDDDDSESEEVDPALQDSIAAAESQQQLQHLQQAALKTQHKERAMMLPSDLPCHHVFANGTACPHVGCKYNHSREAMVARAKQLWLEDTKGDETTQHLKAA